MQIGDLNSLGNKVGQLSIYHIQIYKFNTSESYFQFDWSDIMLSMFSRAGVNSYTSVVVLEKEFLGKVDAYIGTLPNQKM